MNKRGQFYLLAAIVIITVIGGFAAVSNYTQKQSSVKVFDLKDELGIESGKVLEYGVVSDSDTINVEGRPVDIIEHFIEQYEQYAGENKEIYFIYGNLGGVFLVTYDEVIEGSLRIVGATDIPITQNIFGSRVAKTPLEIEDEEGVKVVKVTIENVDYEFEVKPGENFFFIISQEVEGEQHVAIS